MSSPTVKLVCKVTPNAARSELRGWTTDERGRPVLQVKLAAPPVDGKANAELIRFLAEVGGCAKGEITLAQGASGRNKALNVPQSVLEKLSEA